MTDIEKIHAAYRRNKRVANRGRVELEAARSLAESQAVATTLATRDRLQGLVDLACRQQELIDSVNRSLTPMRSVASALAELQTISRIDVNPMTSAIFQQAQDLSEQFRLRFELPSIIARQNLLADFQENPLAEVMSRYVESANSIGRLMQSMTTPWLDVQERLGSVRGLAQIQGISSLLDRSPSYDKQLSAALRFDLGDWRDRITFPKIALEDVGGRVEFYESLGFDASLTNFPAEAFQEALTASSLRREPPSQVKLFAPPIIQEDEEKEPIFERTSTAYSWLLRLETHLRRFIDDTMTRAFGEDWPRHRLPNKLHEEWADKKQKAEQEGHTSRPLVAYADFTDYERVICKRDNWREVFSRHFRRPENIRESLQRLYPIRLDTMHARPITQEDELFLVVEVRRVFKVILPSENGT